MNSKIMKYIFLDIDGVLACDAQMYTNAKKFQKKREWAKELNVLYPFDPICVKVLNEILEATGAEIILSSDWKKFWTFWSTRCPRLRIGKALESYQKK